MSASPSSGTFVARPPKSGMFPRLLYVHGAEQKELQLSLMPFTIGRKTGKDLEIPDPRVSRDHAEIVCEDGTYYVVDGGSKLGTFVNKERITRHKLAQNDRIEFGIGVGAQLIFDPAAEQSIVAREFLSQISSVKTEKANDLEKLALFLDAARKLNTSGALDEILITLIGTTLKLTQAERGFIFLRQADGELTLAAACTNKGERLTSDETISHSILVDATKSASEFIITDTLKSSEMASRQSIVAQSLKTVIAIPLRRAHGQETGEDAVIGVLYMDSRFVSGNISGVSQDILGVIAREAAALVESTHLAKAEEDSRRYQQELGIAAQIQQRLMAVTIPELSYASLSAKNLPCKDIGGDFFDVVVNEDGLTIVVTDVSGKGISAAILASILQGLIYAQVVARVPLPEIVSAANRFLCQKVQGEKYATAVIMRLAPDGTAEILNCGHVPPLMISNGVPRVLKHGNLPVGLMAVAEYESHKVELNPGDRIILVTDGVTEAEDAAGEFFGEERLQQAAIVSDGPCFDHIFASIRQFCGDVPLNDDCTLLELVYRGKSKNNTDSGVNLKT